MRKSDLVYILGFAACFYIGWSFHPAKSDPTCQYVAERYQYLVQHGDEAIYIPTGSLD